MTHVKISCIFEKRSRVVNGSLRIWSDNFVSFWFFLLLKSNLLFTDVIFLVLFLLLLLFCFFIIKIYHILIFILTDLILIILNLHSFWFIHRTTNRLVQNLLIMINLSVVSTSPETLVDLDDFIQWKVLDYD